MPVVLSALADYSIADVVAVARGDAQIAPLSPDGSERMRRIERSSAWVQSAMREVEQAAEQADQPGHDPAAYYGINTGFGDNAGRATFKHVEEAEYLSRKLLLSHCAGAGDHLPEDVVRAALV